MRDGNMKGKITITSHTSKDSNRAKSSDGIIIITAAELLRQQTQQQTQQQQQSRRLENTTKGTTDIETNNRSINDIDDEIQRLERELQQADNDDTEDDASISSSTGSSSSRQCGEQNNNDDTNSTNRDTTMILSISKSNQNPIEKLPTHCLPPPTATNKLLSTKSKGKSKNKKRSRTDDDTNGGNNNIIVGVGLKKAVQELLQNYQGRASTERKPFYCRYCQHQSINYNDFVHHQTIPSHLQNVTIHNKASYCKLCSKQFNSPLQLQEHLQSKPHQERWQYLQSKQQRKPSPHLPHNNNNKNNNSNRQTTHPSQPFLLRKQQPQVEYRK
jgi:hypothetical protein